MTTFAPSSRYERWITSFRLPWMTKVGRRIWGGFAAALGDKSIDWLTQGLLEHLPKYASDPSNALIASERQLDTYPGELVSALAERAPQWLVLAKFFGTPLGLLLGMHFAGFDDAVVVQQNGWAFQLTLPLPDLNEGEQWDPTPNLVKTACSQLAVGLTSSVNPSRAIPAGQRWWQLGPSPAGTVDTDLCSRFVVLFPGPLPTPFLNSTNTARAYFVNSSTAILTWSAELASGYFPLIGQPIVTDNGASVAVAADGTTQTSTSISVDASAAFNGYVDADVLGLSLNDLQRLQATITKWKPRKATCVGIYAALQGKFMGWPVQTQATNTMGHAHIVSYAGA